MIAASRREVADAIHSAAIHLLRRVRKVDEDAMRISLARASALSVLVFARPRAPAELAGAGEVALPTMSRLVAALEHEGLVRRRPHSTDGRSVRLEATAKGRRILERGRGRRLDLLESLLADATADEVDTVRAAAAIVERALRSG